MKSSLIQWYPGHIAKAEKQLKENLSKVDLVIEVRDARIPKATCHPSLHKWIKGKKHLLVINRRDMICERAFLAWDKSFRTEGYIPWWCDAKTGLGVQQIKNAAIREGKELNKRRESRGMLNRPVRALTIGFPNVGKSALINRLVRKKVVASSRRAGVTRALRWVRLGQEIDLLDSPGILPARLDNQESALKLALCDDIGQAAYNIESVALIFLKILRRIENENSSGVTPGILQTRYGVSMEGNDNDPSKWVEMAAALHTSNDSRRMSQRLLDDFRKNLLGQISLELP